MPTPGAVVRGRIIGPPDTDQRLSVVIPGFDHEQRFDDCAYMPRGAIDPVGGEACLLIFDSTGAPWVAAWEPA